MDIKYKIVIIAIILFVTLGDPHDPCKVDEECSYLYSCVDDFCTHKGVWPLAPIEIFGSGVVLIMAGLFMAGGMGGGAMMVPILIYLFKYHSKAAIYNAYAIIFGGASGNFLYSLMEKDYDLGGPQINYDVAALTIPCLLSGTLIGVRLNYAFPETLILLFLTMLVIFTLYKILRRAIRLKGEEDLAFKKERENELNKDEG